MAVNGIILYYLLLIGIFFTISLILDIGMLMQIKRNNLEFQTIGVSFESQYYSSEFILYGTSLLTITVWLSIISFLTIDIIHPIEISAVKTVALLVSIVGVMLNIAARWQRGNYAYINQINPKIVTTGIYRFLPHPQYLGYSLMIMSLPFYFSYFLLPLYPGILLYYFLGKEEERLLKERFTSEIIHQWHYIDQNSEIVCT